MIPILGEAGIALAPVGTLPSTKTFIMMVWGHHDDDMKKFKGFDHEDVCCKPTGGSATVSGQSQCQVGYGT